MYWSLILLKNYMCTHLCKKIQSKCWRTNEWTRIGLSGKDFVLAVHSCPKNDVSLSHPSNKYAYDKAVAAYKLFSLYVCWVTNLVILKLKSGIRMTHLRTLTLQGSPFSAGSRIGPGVAEKKGSFQSQSKHSVEGSRYCLIMGAGQSLLWYPC